MGMGWDVYESEEQMALNFGVQVCVALDTLRNVGKREKERQSLSSGSLTFLAVDLSLSAALAKY